MTSDKKKNEGAPPARPTTPSSGEGSDSALDAMKKKRKEVPPADGTLPLTPPPKK